MTSFETFYYEKQDNNVALVTLNRPEDGNTYNQTMLDEFEYLWELIREDMDVHVVVLRALGDDIFSLGADAQGLPEPANVWSQVPPFRALGPKHNRVWKPVVCAVHGLVSGGGVLFVNESDIVISTPEAQFCISNVSHDHVAAAEPIGLRQRVPLGEALRMALMGEDERVSAETALRMSLVTELVPRMELWPRAEEIAASIAAKDYRVIQGTVMAIWESLEYGYRKALARTVHFQDRAYTEDRYYDTERGTSALRKRFEAKGRIQGKE